METAELLRTMNADVTRSIKTWAHDYRDEIKEANTIWKKRGHSWLASWADWLLRPHERLQPAGSPDGWHIMPENMMKQTAAGLWPVPLLHGRSVDQAVLRHR
jgi:hypothetical protein